VADLIAELCVMLLCSGREDAILKLYPWMPGWRLEKISHPRPFYIQSGWKYRRISALGPQTAGDALSPVPYRGNVVARVNCPEWIHNHQCLFFWKPPHLFPPCPTPFVQNHFRKHFNGVDTTPRFSKTFSKLFFECSHPRVLAPLEVFQGLCC
jgi:hypothetical protein